jgi:ankyrin repeat protein
MNLILFFLILISTFVLFQIEKGAKINARDFYGNSPLHLACRVGDLSVVTHLLKNDANVNARNYIG